LRRSRLATLLGAAAVAATGGIAVLSFAAGAGGVAAGTPTRYLLCGTEPAPAADFSGDSQIDHPSDAAMGNVYVYSGQRCEDEQGQSSSFQFTWTVNHGNVDLNAGNPNYERGTEHGILTTNAIPGYSVGFNGQITNFDFQEAGDTCAAAQERQDFYDSGNRDPNGCAPPAPGNINTHGGAATMQHFNGHYGSTAYKYDSQAGQPQSPCPTSQSTTFCFEAVLIGSTN
jgi:hypothetical protein